MIDEMTAMNEEISKLKAEVERLRDALQSVLDNLPEAGTYDFEISRSNTTIQSIVSTALFAANVTSEAPQASEPKFKVGDFIKFKADIAYGVNDAIYVISEIIKDEPMRYKIKGYYASYIADELESA